MNAEEVRNKINSMSSDEFRDLMKRVYEKSGIEFKDGENNANASKVNTEEDRKKLICDLRTCAKHNKLSPYNRNLMSNAANMLECGRCAEKLISDLHICAERNEIPLYKRELMLKAADMLKQDISCAFTEINKCESAKDSPIYWLRLANDIAVDYDGYNTVQGLQSVIDEMSDCISNALKLLYKGGIANERGE